MNICSGRSISDCLIGCYNGTNCYACKEYSRKSSVKSDVVCLDSSEKNTNVSFVEVNLVNFNV